MHLSLVKIFCSCIVHLASERRRSEQVLEASVPLCERAIGRKVNIQRENQFFIAKVVEKMRWEEKKALEEKRKKKMKLGVEVEENVERKGEANTALHCLLFPLLLLNGNLFYVRAG